MARNNPWNDPAYWQRKAEEARGLASTLRDPIAQQTALEIAGMYKQLAEIVKTRPIAH